jgi:hypothetical protein
MRPARLNQWIGQLNTEPAHRPLDHRGGRQREQRPPRERRCRPSPADPASVVVTLSYAARGQRGAEPQQLSLTLTLGGLG